MTKLGFFGVIKSTRFPAKLVMRSTKASVGCRFGGGLFFGEVFFVHVAWSTVSEDEGEVAAAGVVLDGCIALVVALWAALICHVGLTGCCPGVGGFLHGVTFGV